MGWQDRPVCDLVLAGGGPPSAALIAAQGDFVGFARPSLSDLSFLSLSADGSDVSWRSYFGCFPVGVLVTVGGGDAGGPPLAAAALAPCFVICFFAAAALASAVTTSKLTILGPCEPCTRLLLERHMVDCSRSEARQI